MGTTINYSYNHRRLIVSKAHSTDVLDEWGIRYSFDPINNRISIVATKR
ncbi:MAG: hypothetical protein H7296_05580 [Bacteroidia bacterium]|nr:hypothetical protein [Bacteroidia bacterium]